MTNNPYSRTGSSGLELDLRAEMDDLLFGSYGEVAKGKVGLLRKMRIDSNGEHIRCPCRNKVTDEPSRDQYCRYCHGHGYFWDETQIVYYKNNDSFVKDGEGLFYLQYDLEITERDYIIELKLDSEGRPIEEIERESVYEIESADKFRADNGRIEFWQISAKYNREWSVHYGVKNRQYYISP